MMMDELQVFPYVCDIIRFTKSLTTLATDFQYVIAQCSVLAHIQNSSWHTTFQIEDLHILICHSLSSCGRYQYKATLINAYQNAS